MKELKRYFGNANGHRNAHGHAHAHGNAHDHGYGHGHGHGQVHAHGTVTPQSRDGHATVTACKFLSRHVTSPRQ
jgi:hypothetical protein